MRNAQDNKREFKIARIRREIEILLHSSLHEEEWEDLVEEHYVEELLNDTLSSSEVAEKVRRRRQVYGQREARRDKAPQMLSEQEVKKPSGRTKALSLLVAQEAARDAEVQAFRTDVLGGELVSLEAVEEWIQGQAKADGPYTWWLLDVPIPRSYMIDVIIGGLTEHGVFDREERPLGVELTVAPVTDDFHFRFLKYSIPGSEEWKEIPTYVDGILEHLRWLSEKLAEEYGWAEAEATLFVLTGHVPQINPVTHTFHSRQIRALSRIVLTVDSALSPREVADHYRRIRQEIIGGRHRELSEKHMQLAIFAAKQMGGETWADKMAEWNKTHPAEWEYQEVSNFAHDCLQARRRLLRSE